MTDDEKRQQRAMLLLECQEAEEELAHLSEKARKVTEKLRVLISFVESARPGEMKHVTYADKALVVKEKLHSQVVGNPGFREGLSFDLLLALVGELDQATEKLTELRRQKQSLGLTSTASGAA
jgi:hypothetical protein